MYANEIRNHLNGDMIEALISPGIENGAGDSLIMSQSIVPVLVAFSAVEVCVSSTQAAELADGLQNHAVVCPAGCLHGLSAGAFQAAVEPVHNGQVILAQPAVTERALQYSNGILAFQNRDDSIDVVVQPDHVEVVHGIFEATPLSVFVQTGLVFVQIAKTHLGAKLFAFPEPANCFRRIGNQGLAPLFQTVNVIFNVFFDLRLGENRHINFR